ncbi:amidohydrolase [Ochrobactrum sp. S46]|nr:amidohydrolase [Ochrobactrum sp. S45]MBK0046137.1 amidohydrolase [Ochrobactrum sp. S46]
MSDIKTDALNSYLPELIQIRHLLHSKPETAFEEIETSALVAAKLREWGIEVHEGIGRTGIVGVLKGSRPGQRCISLRADMDALNILENNDVDYVSAVSGKMHACGHDGHTTMLLGAARYLAEHPDFAGTVQFVFQPAEETGKGAAAMMADGLFERFPTDAMYGLHTEPGLPVGQLATRSGVALAGSLTFHIMFKGSGGHGGASPHMAKDTTIPLAHFILALQSIVGRNVSSLDTAVISVGHISGGSVASPNVMPTEMLVSGTARYFREEVMEIICSRIEELAQLFAQTSHCDVSVEISRETPPLMNNNKEFGVAIEAASLSLGRDNVNSQRPLSTGAEDFAYFTKEIPSAYVWLGAGVGPDGLVHDVHTEKFNFNDESLLHGVNYWINLVNLELRSQE